MYFYITLDIAAFLSFQDKYEPQEADGETGIVFIKVCHKVNRLDGRKRVFKISYDTKEGVLQVDPKRQKKKRE